MCGVENEEVRACCEKCARTVGYVSGNADRCAAEKTTLFVLCRVRIAFCLFDVLDRDKTAELAFAVNDRELFNLVVTEDVACFFERRADGNGDEVFLGHHFVDLYVEVVHEAEVTVGDDADELVVVVNDRHTGDLVLAHELVSFVNVVVRVEEERIGNNAVFASLYSFNLVALHFDGHVLVDNACAAFTCHRNRESRFGNGVHCRTHERNVKCDFLGELCLEGNRVRENIALRRDEKHIVKGKTFVRNFAFE